MSGEYYTDHWASKIKQYKILREKGECHIWQKGRRLQLVCPYNARFVQVAIGLSGNWRDKTGIWSFRIQSYTLVKAEAIKFFGKDKVIIGAITVPRERLGYGS